MNGIHTRARFTPCMLNQNKIDLQRNAPYITFLSRTQRILTVVVVFLRYVPSRHRRIPGKRRSNSHAANAAVLTSRKSPVSSMRPAVSFILSNNKFTLERDENLDQLVRQSRKGDKQVFSELLTRERALFRGFL